MSRKTKGTAPREEAVPTLVPKLRFPEFRGAEGWESKRLGLVLKFQAGFPFPSSGFNDVGNGLRLIRNRDLRSDDIVMFYADEFDANFVVNSGDVLVGMDGDFTPTVWQKGVALLNQRVGRVLPRDDNDQRFLLYLLTLCLKGIEEATARTTVKHLSHSAVENKHEPVPTLPEQQQIAECLSSVDEVIAAQARKVDALKTHKKGLMQQLFPRKGETQPRLRFPEFRDAGGWGSDSLGSIFDTSSGGTPDRTKEEYWNGSIPWITTSLVGFNIITESDEFITDAGLSNSSAKLFPEKTILVAMYGQGKTRGQVAMLGVKAATNQACAAILPRKDIDPRFVFLNLGSRYEEFRRLSNSGGQANLSQGLIQGLQFSYPNDVVEQQRIADCLTSLDALITAETQKFEALKTHKRGMMQQLFPSPEAVAA